MKTIITKTLLTLCALFALSSLSSCEDDDWMTRSDLSGTWRIDYVIPLDYGPCPYRPTDRLVFNYDGRFEAYKYGQRGNVVWMGACVLHLKCFLTSSLFCPIRLHMLKISELCNPIGWFRVTH